MALNGTTLGSSISTALEPEIKAQLQNFFTIGADSFSQSQFNNFCHYLALSIGNIVGPKVVTHIVSNGLVTGTVTSGAGSGGTTTGTIS